MGHLPDITAVQSADTALTLKWVGMEHIALPIHIPISSSQVQQTHAQADVFVSLDSKQAKGIHMSRLYQILNQHLSNKAMTPHRLEHLLRELISSQQGLSHSAKLQLSFDLILEKKALISDKSGYQGYPVTLHCEYHQGQFTIELGLSIPYSSTCPCSAALSRQALSDAIACEFTDDAIDKNTLLNWLSSEQGSIATPHSQRSFAYIHMQMQGHTLGYISDLITEFEAVIATAVQTAVKREDEQAFAKLNAENLLFCEDAARRIKQALQYKPRLLGYWFKVEHQESLHAHNAVVVDYKRMSTLE
ncbi:GTP cyclohydrolase I FolE2 [Pseudoalteromonas sp. CO325X]|uniref:GTP cyclohydrolase FolE2 n=1 Tax=Pseudoalteromonas sp. CO325X TaxID=1777262 RepID=UPI0010231845|nr:GTP cyclohydrolase FolE2 [Pseudoalteromonas sp. CO325X]RZF78446.1 GTP cyclohydrolase I FolE2 [Pseudoalteromonas sp. CO325X]